ncbi:hypothetical protein M011DRAFT_470493, partial [Sporormia fimetaria CBS 119925]
MTSRRAMRNPFANSRVTINPGEVCTFCREPPKDTNVPFYFMGCFPTSIESHDHSKSGCAFKSMLDFLKEFGHERPLNWDHVPVCSSCAHEAEGVAKDAKYRLCCLRRTHATIEGQLVTTDYGEPLRRAWESLQDVWNERNYDALLLDHTHTAMRINQAWPVTVYKNPFPCHPDLFAADLERNNKVWRALTPIHGVMEFANTFHQEVGQQKLIGDDGSFTPGISTILLEMWERAKPSTARFGTYQLQHKLSRDNYDQYEEILSLLKDLKRAQTLFKSCEKDEMV